MPFSGHKERKELHFLVSHWRNFLKTLKIMLTITESSSWNRSGLLGFSSLKYRCVQVAMEDDTLANILLGSDMVSVDPGELSRALQRTCVSGSLVPVLCGSALRGIAIQPLMDAAVNYLPPASVLSSRM